jgi:predicted nuclease with TOPRIM domain
MSEEGGRRTDDRIMDRLDRITSEIHEVRVSLQSLRGDDQALSQAVASIDKFVNRLEARIDSVLEQDLPRRVGRLEEWQTWAMRIVLGAVIAAVVGFVLVGAP